MTTTSTAAATSLSPVSSTSTSTSQQALNQNYQTFLTLLTTQLQNQDPLDPQDSSQFTNQLVEFSQVEQQINTNSTLGTMLTNQEAGLTENAVNYIGHTVAGTGNEFSLDGKDSVPLGYTLSAAAAASTVTVSDGNGNLVYSAAGETAAGSHAFTFNGEDASGNALPAGTYTLAVNAFDNNGNQVSTTTVVPGTVSSVTASGGTTYLTVGGNSVPITDVDSVGGSSSTATATN